jgi:hypothetical protein
MIIPWYIHTYICAPCPDDKKVEAAAMIQAHSIYYILCKDNIMEKIKSVYYSYQINKYHCLCIHLPLPLHDKRPIHAPSSTSQCVIYKYMTDSSMGQARQEVVNAIFLYKPIVPCIVASLSGSHNVL